MQRLEVTRRTHLNWPFTTTSFPDQVVQGAPEHTETITLEDAITVVGVDRNGRPPKFHTGKKPFQREANTNARMTKNEAQHATNRSQYQTCVTTMNYVFTSGQYVLYDTLTMTSDVADLSGIKYGAGQAATDQFALMWRAEKPQNKTDPHCQHAEVHRGTATLQGHQIIVEDPKMALEIAATPIKEPCPGDKPLWPSTVCCYLAEFARRRGGERPKKPAAEAEGSAKVKEEELQRWENVHKLAQNEIDAELGHARTRLELEKLKTRAAEQPAERRVQRMPQQLTQEPMMMDPTSATRLLTGDETLAATHARPVTMQVYKCRTITDFRARWKGMDSERKCYDRAPATLKDGRQHYLGPGARERVPSAKEIKCEERPKFAYKTAPHQLATTDEAQTVHAVPSTFDYERIRATRTL